MRIAAAYTAVVVLWGTTPLAIKWSGEGPGFLFGVTGRMAIGTLCVLALLPLTRHNLPMHRKAVLSYLAGAVQIFGAMVAVYWSSQFIPSGWISVVFGLSPLLTALMAAAWLGERALGFRRLLAFALGIAGLLQMFGSAREFGGSATAGVTGVFVSTLLQCGSAVWIKRIDAGLPALSQLGGSLVVAMPAYLATWGLADNHWPAALSTQNLLAIVYLGVVATTLGFSLYFFLLRRLTATALSLISLVSPILALLLGHWINHEPLTARILTGTSLVMGALLLHQWDGSWAKGKRLAGPRG
ncbi:MAG: DMT family transporter [Methylotetracoccus sp.]|jgi:drug/metabolite transporter (DMT)-like permease|nr:DMT family transporter [Methylotetracoccus sp.]